MSPDCVVEPIATPPLCPLHRKLNRPIERYGIILIYFLFYYHILSSVHFSNITTLSIMDQYNTPSPTSHPADTIDNKDNIDNDYNNYPMTPNSSDNNKTGTDTNDLIEQLDNLTNELELERAKNEPLTSNFTIYHNEQNEITAN